MITHGEEFGEDSAFGGLQCILSMQTILVWYRHFTCEIRAGTFENCHSSGSICPNFPRHIFGIYQKIRGEHQGLWTSEEKAGKQEVRSKDEHLLTLLITRIVLGWVMMLPSQSLIKSRAVRRKRKKRRRKQKMSFKMRDCASTITAKAHSYWKWPNSL